MLESAGRQQACRQLDQGSDQKPCRWLTGPRSWANDRVRAPAKNYPLAGAAGCSKSLAPRQSRLSQATAGSQSVCMARFQTPSQASDRLMTAICPLPRGRSASLFLACTVRLNKLRMEAGRACPHIRNDDACTFGRSTAAQGSKSRVRRRARPDNRWRLERAGTRACLETRPGFSMCRSTVWRAARNSGLCCHSIGRLLR